MLSPDNIAFITDNADADRLGLACQLTFWGSQGLFPDEEADLAPATIAHLAGQIIARRNSNRSSRVSS